MLIFSKEFGSEDPIADAIKTAGAIAERDFLGYEPHMGIGYGKIAVGLVGNKRANGCSAVGFPVTIANRCTGIRPQEKNHGSIVIPSELWEGYDIFDLLPPEKNKLPNGKIRKIPRWQILEERNAPIKNLDSINIREIIKTTFCMATPTPEEKAKADIKEILGEL